MQAPSIHSRILLGSGDRNRARAAANGVHGLNDRIEARSLFVGRDYPTDLVKLYAG